MSARLYNPVRLADSTIIAKGWISLRHYSNPEDIELSDLVGLRESTPSCGHKGAAIYSPCEHKSIFFAMHPGIHPNVQSVIYDFCEEMLAKMLRTKPQGSPKRV